MYGFIHESCTCLSGSLKGTTINDLGGGPEAIEKK